METNRNPYFLPSGFEPQEIINILEAKGDNKKRLDKIKERKRQEDRRIKLIRLTDSAIRIAEATKRPKQDMIQYGFDLARWWGEQHE